MNDIEDEIKAQIEDELESLKTYLEENEDEIDEDHEEFIEHQIGLKESYLEAQSYEVFE